MTSITEQKVRSAIRAFLYATPGVLKQEAHAALKIVAANVDRNTLVVLYHEEETAALRHSYGCAPR